MEENHTYYDRVYKYGGYHSLYRKHYSESIYFPIWQTALSLIKKVKNPKCLEIGCGSGQFAQLLFDTGYNNYKGFDFSPEAIKLAKQTNETYKDQFLVDDAYESTLYEECNYNIVILFEVLEHMQEDLKVLRSIKKDTHVFFSVPSFDSKSHVRYYSSEQEISHRYKNVLTLNRIYPFPISKKNRIYLVQGRR